MGRLRVRSDENDKLAETWARDDVVFVTMNWRPAFEFAQRRESSMSVEVIRRDASPQNNRSGKVMPTSEHRYLMYVAPDDRRPYEFHTPDQSTYYEMPKREAAKRVQAILGDLARRYSKLCVCSLRLRYALNGLQTLGVQLPRGTVLIDLVKVVEFQSAPDSIDEMLGVWRAELVERRARYGAWAGACHLTGEASSTRVLTAVGPRAHGYRQDLHRIERESRAAERLRVPLGAREVMRIRRERPRA